MEAIVICIVDTCTSKHLRNKVYSISCLFLFFFSVIGNDGFYIILKGLARPQAQIYKNMIEEHESTTSFIPQSFHSFVFSEDFRNPLLTGVGPMVRNEYLLLQ